MFCEKKLFPLFLVSKIDETRRLDDDLDKSRESTLSSEARDWTAFPVSVCLFSPLKASISRVNNLCLHLIWRGGKGIVCVSLADRW